MTTKYYACIDIPTTIARKIIHRRDSILAQHGFDLHKLYRENNISRTFHWTIKAPFQAHTQDQYQVFKTLVQEKLADVKNNHIEIKRLCPPFGHWTEETIKQVGSLVPMHSIALQIDCAKSVIGNDLKDFQNAVIIDCFFEQQELYTSVEQFNMPHVSILTNMHEVPLKTMHRIYPLLAKIFSNTIFSFSVERIHIMKKVASSGWTLYESIPIPFCN